jgi:GntR family transcriptional regulator
VSTPAGDPEPGGGLVDLRSPVPLTDQLAAILRAAISGGTLTGSLPSEKELGERHQVSRVTVRRALEALRDERLIYPAKGRGWFVTRPDRPVNPPTP